MLQCSYVSNSGLIWWFNSIKLPTALVLVAWIISQFVRDCFRSQYHTQNQATEEREGHDSEVALTIAIHIPDQNSLRWPCPNSRVAGHVDLQMRGHTLLKSGENITKRKRRGGTLDN